MSRDDSIPAEPFPLLDDWWREAERHAAIRYAHAAVLATVESRDDRVAPDARVVLVHERGPDGFVISTDDRSPKAEQMRTIPEVALVIHWEPLERQVRVRGHVEPADPATAERCFAERPRESRITAWASRQGPGLADRASLDAAWTSAAERFEGVETVPRPESWRAYRIVPRSIELWRAGARRLHDRLAWTREGDGWRFERHWP